MSDSFAFFDLREHHPDLFQMAYIFNCMPALYVHSSYWPTAFKKEHIRILLANRHTQAALSALVLEQAGIAGTFVEDFSCPAWRLALFPPRIIQKLFLYVGAALCHERIRAVVEKDQQKALKTQLGEDIYHFAVKGAALVINPHIQLPAQEDQDLFSHILKTAQQALALHFAGAPLGLTVRFALKLPAALKWEWIKSNTHPSSAGASSLIQKILIRHIAPEVAPCFQ